MPRIALKYGAIAAAILIAVTVLPFPFQSWEGLAPDEAAARIARGEFIGYATMVLAMALVFFAVREERRRRDEPLRFGGAFKVGALTSLIAAVLFGAANTVMFAAIGPEQTSAFMETYVRASLGPEADAAAVEQALADYEAMKGLMLNPFFQGLLMLLTVLPIGLVLSALAAWWHTRPGPTANAGEAEAASLE